MTKPLKLHIPHVITEFDENMVVPLSRNFGEIQRHVAGTQLRVDTLEDDLEALTTVVDGILALLST